MENMFRKGKVSLLFLATIILLSSFCNNPVRDVSQKQVEGIIAVRKEASSNLLNSAKRWTGVEELTGNNDHPMITQAMKLCGLPGDKGYPWCAACISEIHYSANVPAPHSARVTAWFKNNVVWKREWGEKQFTVKQGMVGAIYYSHLGRYGHIVLIIAQDNNNYYTLEGNTNAAGSREGQGFYKKIRSKKSIAAIADYCLSGQLFSDEYDNLLKRTMQ